jgi:hypothetical protein
MQLDVNGINNATPTADDIRRAVDARSGDDWYISIDRDDGGSIEAYVADDAVLRLEYDEGDTFRRSDGPVDAARVKEILVHYLNRDERWRDGVTWVAPPPVTRFASPSRGQSPPVAVIVSLVVIVGAAFLVPQVLPRFVKLPAPFDQSDFLGIGTFVAGVIVALIVIVLVKVAESRRASAWPQVGGRILRSGIETRHHDTDDGTSVSQASAVEYEFSVGGVRYVGTRVGIGEREDATELAATLQRYPVGATILVHYDPKDPRNCVLEPKLPKGLGKGCFALLAIAAVFVAGIYWLATRGPALVMHYFPKAQAPFVLAATGFSAVTLLFFFAMWRRAREAAHWPVANGQIVVSTTQSFRKTDSDGDSTIRHAPAVEYAYRVNGIEYRSRQIKLDTKVSGSQGYAAKVAARYPVGRNVEVRYDPRDPSSAALEAQSRAYWLILLVAIVIFGVAIMATGAFND